MILKTFESKKINLDTNKIVLFYGQNDGHKEEEISKILITNKNREIIKYTENEVLENSENFYNNILSESFFSQKKILIVNRASDKIFKIIEYLNDKSFSDVFIIINAKNLEKKSKLRSFFEKSKELITIAFYPDNNQTLMRNAALFFKENKIPISQENLNLVISKCSGDRGILKNDLNKIKLFSLNKKKITTDELIKLISLIENHNISELIDNCLAKNKNKTIYILNENHLSADDCIIITRTFSIKLKRLLKLCELYKETKNLESTISNAKPPVFWKDKEIVKKQISSWSIEQIKKSIYEINNIEIEIKKNYSNSLNIITNFILQITLLKPSSGF